VGASGSGKTTLIKLLPNFYNLNKGEIIIGASPSCGGIERGFPLSDINPHLWRHHAGTVMQDGFIFSDTIANNERIIMDNLNDFYKGKTVVIVAHRLSTVQHADNIIVLDKGKIVEEGTHKELTAKKGAYYTLVKNQLELGT
jgi:ABC-type multidrug transport system fused ATPase/permease subunit